MLNATQYLADHDR